MTTTAAPISAHILASSDVYDPDDVVPQNSPLLVPARVSFRPSPTPPPLVQVSSPPSSPDASTSRRKHKRRHKVRPSQADAVLVGFMDSGRRPDIASMAGEMPLASDTSEEASSTPEADSSGDDDESYSVSPREAEAGTGPKEDMINGAQDNNDHGPLAPSPDLQSLAVGAMVALGLGGKDASRTPTTSGEMDTEEASPPAPASSPGGSAQKEDRPRPLAPSVTSPSYSTHDHFSPRHASLPQRPADLRSPTGSVAGLNGELPPIQNASPRSEANSGMMLPSIRDQLGDIRNIPPDIVSPPYSSHHSPPGVPAVTRLPGLNHASPPISPHATFPGSPHSLMGMPSPYNPYPSTNGMYHRPSIDYNSSSTTQTPSTDHSASTPATSTHSVADKMSLDGVAFNNPQDIGGFICKFEGCTAAPFQTQYLLNSHANVHSSSRPHYCSVKGCPRSEGGKGFKRKNEMIRHGLVHESPGYVCPFCPEREHKYPRPDNLQR